MTLPDYNGNYDWSGGVPGETFLAHGASSDLPLAQRLGADGPPILYSTIGGDAPHPLKTGSPFSYRLPPKALGIVTTVVTEGDKL